MRKRIKNIQNIYNVAKVAFIQKSLFYNFSLDKRNGVFSVEKFITDPWAGNAAVGKNILDGKLFVPGIDSNIDILNVVLEPAEYTSHILKYVTGFSWIRELQAIGGNNSRKYTRKAIIEFIDKYRSTKRFWLKPTSWEASVIGERIVNWMLSYSFFASGSSDKFQKDVLSSINEQFSHLVRIYKAEQVPYQRLIALKAIFFCLCSMNNNRARHIKKILKEFCELIKTSLDEFGMFLTRNPMDHFSIFMSVLEIRFMARSSGIEIPEDVFYRMLSKMASCVRFLRLGDGCISCYSGEEECNGYMIQSRHIIDTALSLVDIDHYNEKNNKVVGFDRLSTKKAIIIINTKICNRKSKFNTPREPGINVFDFEASVGTVRLINRSDISILFNGFRVKADETSLSFFKKKIVSGDLHFFGELQHKDRLFDFAVRRELYPSASKPMINGTDFVYISGNYEASFRFVLNENAEVEQINQKKVLITINKKEFLFKIRDVSANSKVIIQKAHYPSIEVIVENNSDEETMLDWMIEEIVL